jgi:hemerythrin
MEYAMPTPVELRERARLLRLAATKESGPELKQMLASQAFALAQLAEKHERESKFKVAGAQTRIVTGNAKQRLRPLLWNESFTIGQPVLDAHHRQFVELINDIGTAVNLKGPPAPCTDLLNALRQVVREHAREEDAILWELRSGMYEPLRSRPQIPRAMADAAFDVHFAEHKTMLDHFDVVVLAPFDTLCESLKAWFLDHVTRHESPLKAIFQAM